MTIPSINASRTSLASVHTDPADVPLPPSPTPSRRASASDGFASGLQKLASQAKKPDGSRARRELRTLPTELHQSIAEHLSPADIASFARMSKDIYGSLKPVLNKRQVAYESISARAEAAQSLDDLHEIFSSVQPEHLTFQDICNKIGLKISGAIGTINALPEANRAAAVQRCLTSYSQMEPAAMRAAGLGRAVGMAKSVLPEHHQAVFDDGLKKMKETVPNSERGPVLKALIAVTVSSEYDGTGPASESVAGNIRKVLDNMDGLSVETRRQIVTTAMNQTKELCEPGWSQAMGAIRLAYGKLS